MEQKMTTGGNKSAASFPIVGIGASAGGLYSLQCFLTVLSREFDFAVVFMQHLSPKHKSLLPELLRSRRADLEIIEIHDGLEVLPGRLYLCPPGKEVRIRKEVFHVTDPAANHVHLPIDEFFVSLAEEAGERVIGLIFSGAGTDGARGIRAIRAAGGMVFVQDPATAEFPGMPLAAVGTGQTDGVLPPEEIAREIQKLRGIGETAASPEKVIAPSEFETFFSVLRDKTGYRFDHYKKTVVSRRIRRRMYLRGMASVPDYIRMVMEQNSEATALASDLMIGVTSFFRDHLAWKALRIGVVRKFTAEDDDSPVRVWTPACASGEEAYSIAMMLRREFDLAGRKREIQVFASDVNDLALDKAREGRYPGSIAADVLPDYMRNFFTCAEDGLSVIVDKQIREHVVFARQDLLADPPFSRLDLIICRNLLIYLEPEAQEKCISIFHYALKDGGYLFLGNAESVGRNSMLFKSLSHKKCRVYQKLERTPSGRLPLAGPFTSGRTPPFPLRQTPGPENNQQSVSGFIQGVLLEEYAPAAVAVDQNYDIIYHNGQTGRYLRQPRGAPTQNLLELLPENLRNRIRGALYRSGQEGKPVLVRAGIPGEEGKRRQVTIRISRLRGDLFLAMFREKGGAAEQEKAVSSETSDADETVIRQLESELSATRSDLQNHIEQLKSLNEEFQSSNEELQAANEELETSREELQSLNEELITVNSQLQSKIEEQEETNNDLHNFLTSTNIPTIFLDHQFRVKRFTPAMSRLVKLIPGDVGRPISDMSRENLGPDLLEDAGEVLDHLVPVTKEIVIDDTWYIRSSLPYRTSDNRIEGVVVTYNNITDLKCSEARTRHLASFPQLNPDPVIELDSSGNVTFSNPGILSILEDLGLDKGDVHFFLPHDLDGILKDLARKEGTIFYREVNVGDRVFAETVHLVPQFDVVRIYARDITARKRAEEALQESEGRVRQKLESILSPEGDIGDLELGDIIDSPAIQSLVGDLYEFVHLPIGILDLKGKVLIGVGWQDVCTKFHRVHPETCGHCAESDLELTKGVSQGEFKLYKCKNGMWDAVTPVMVGGRHMGNLFWGQFFFEGETLDSEFFRAQARKYGFDEGEYLAALEKVPRISRESLDRGMAFYLKLADMVSKLSYSNIKLARSLSERDALLHSLEESEARLERAQEIAHLGSWDLDLVKNTLTWSDEVYRIFGLQPQEFGATYEAFLDAVHPDDRPAVDAAYSGSVRDGRDTYEIGHRVVRKDTGEVRFVHEKCEHFRDETGRIIRSVGMVYDITESKRSEEALLQSLSRFELLTTTAGELLQSTEPQKVVESVCRKVMEYLDCHAFFNFLVDEQAGKLHLNAFAGIPEEEARRIEWLDFGVAVCGCAARDGQRIVAEHIPTTPDGRTELVKSYGIKAYCCHPLLAPGGKVIGTLSFGTCSRETFSEEDLSLMKAVTDQVAAAVIRMRNEADVLKLSEDMAIRNVELESVNKELESFIYSVSHDLRAPLRSMGGFAKIMVEDYWEKFDEQGRDYLRRIVNGSEKMTQLIDDLLNLSKISRQELLRMEIDITKLAQSVVSELRESDPGRSVEVTIAEGLTGIADRRLTEIVLSNLLGNAWKFTSKTEHARIELGTVEKGGKTIYYVRDNGAGFNPEYVDKMFWPFQRLHSEKEFPGTGIGLTIVERVIRRYGGKVWAEGEVDKGATVYFTLG